MYNNQNIAKASHFISCNSKTTHTHDSKHVSDIRDEDGHRKNDTQDDYSCKDVDQHGKGTSSKQQQDGSLTGLQRTNKQR